MYYGIHALFLFALGFLVTRIMLPLFIKLINQAQFKKPNFRGDLIPTSTGLVFFPASFFISSVYYFLFIDLQPALIFLLTVAVFTFLGTFDDVWGATKISGIAGHFKELLHGRLTTGAIKAMGGLFSAFIIATFLGPQQAVPASALIIALSANTINLLDRQPGRAGKAFLLVALIFIIIGWGCQQTLLLISILGCLLAYLYDDLRAKTMMGDAGANPLGATLGFFAIRVLSEPYQIVYLAFLLLFHLLTEKYSLTKIIAKNRFLNYLDKLGR